MSIRVLRETISLSYPKIIYGIIFRWIYDETLFDVGILGFLLDDIIVLRSCFSDNKSGLYHNVVQTTFCILYCSIYYLPYHSIMFHHGVPGYLCTPGDDTVICLVRVKPQVLPDLPLFLGELIR